MRAVSGPEPTLARLIKRGQFPVQADDTLGTPACGRTGLAQYDELPARPEDELPWEADLMKPGRRVDDADSAAPARSQQLADLTLSQRDHMFFGNNLGDFDTEAEARRMITSRTRADKFTGSRCGVGCAIRPRSFAKPAHEASASLVPEHAGPVCRTGLPNYGPSVPFNELPASRRQSAVYPRTKRTNKCLTSHKER